MVPVETGREYLQHLESQALVSCLMKCWELNPGVRKSSIDSFSHLAISTGSRATLIKSTSQSSEASLSWLVVLGPMCDYLGSGLSFLLFILFLT